VTGSSKGQGGPAGTGSGGRAAPGLTAVSHSRVCYDRGRYCGHPRQSGIFLYGGAEIALLHSHAPSAYSAPEDVSHSFATGYASRARILLQRSTDGGRTWPAEHEVAVWDESLPLEEKRARLYRADDAQAAREHICLSDPDAAVYFARPATGPDDDRGRPGLECFAFRSGDRGRTWEQTPTRVRPPTGWDVVHRDAHPLVQCPDGTQLGAMTLGRGGVAGNPVRGAVALYGTDDDGLTWEYLSLAVEDGTGFGRPTYAGLILLPSGVLQCYSLNIGGRRNAIQVSVSQDCGYSWSAPRPIVAWGQSPWRGSGCSNGQSPGPGSVCSANATPARRTPATEQRPHSARGVHYRSPWPMRLRDGRIVVLFGRRKPPFGMGLIVSEDDGATWSREAVLRDDGAGRDLGYPVAVELADGEIFAAYYFTDNDGNGCGGTRYIAGTHFRLA